MADLLPPTKLTTLRAHMAAGEWREALRLAARFPNLGTHRGAITRGWEAFARPGFYRGLGQDPQAHIDAGIAALKERYPA